MSLAKPLSVVAGLIVKRGRFLLARRPPHKARGGLWEFPGGKIEPGESASQALLRELQEELGVKAQILRPLGEIFHQYPDLAIKLKGYLVRIEGSPHPLEGQELGWFSPEEIPFLNLAPADQKLWNLVKERVP